MSPSRFALFSLLRTIELSQFDDRAIAGDESHVLTSRALSLVNVTASLSSVLEVNCLSNADVTLLHCPSQRLTNIFGFAVLLLSLPVDDQERMLLSFSHDPMQLLRFCVAGL
jgi:hypothetical protein